MNRVKTNITLEFVLSIVKVDLRSYWPNVQMFGWKQEVYLGKQVMTETAS